MNPEDIVRFRADQNIIATVAAMHEADSGLFWIKNCTMYPEGHQPILVLKSQWEVISNGK